MHAAIRSLVEACRFLEPVRDSRLAAAFASKWNQRSHECHRRRIRNLRLLFGHHGVRYVFDVGANVGSMTAVYLQLGSRVLCIEPDPGNVRRLRHRFRWRSGVRIEAKGAGRKDGRLSLNRYAALGAFDTFSDKRVRLLADRSLGEPLEPHDRIAVPLETLDQFIATHGRPDYIKIDVEGFEAEVLAGLSEPVPLLSFECNLPEFEAETLDCISMVNRLHRSYRYNFWPIDHTCDLMSDRWLDAEEIAGVVRDGGRRFMEIVAALRN